MSRVSLPLADTNAVISLELTLPWHKVCLPFSPEEVIAVTIARIGTYLVTLMIIDNFNDVFAINLLFYR